MANKDGAQQSALEKFFAGKGFYIVLFLCAAVIGVSAWTLLSREGAVDETMDDYRPAVTAPAPTKQAWDEDDGDGDGDGEEEETSEEGEHGEVSEPGKSEQGIFRHENVCDLQDL